MSLRRALVDAIVRRRRIEPLGRWDLSIPRTVPLDAERVTVFGRLLDPELAESERVAPDVPELARDVGLTSQSEHWMYLVADVSGSELEVSTRSVTGWCGTCSGWRCAHRLAFWLALAWHTEETRWVVERPLWELVLLPFADERPTAGEDRDDRHQGWVRYHIRWPLPDLGLEEVDIVFRELMRRSKSSGRTLKPMKMPRDWDKAAARIRGLSEVDQQVHAILERLEALRETQGLTRSYRMERMVEELSRQAMGELFEALATCSDVRLDNRPVKVSTEPITPVIRAKTGEDGGLDLRWEPAWSLVVDVGPGYVLIDDVLHPLSDSDERLRTLVNQPLPRIPRQHVSGFIDGFVLKAPVRLELDTPNDGTGSLSGVQQPESVTARLVLGETLEALTVDVRFAYRVGAAVVEAAPGDKTPLLAVDTLDPTELTGHTALVRRRWPWERAMLDDLQLATGERGVPLELTGTAAYDFLIEGLPRLSASWEVFGTESLKLHRVSGRVTPTVSVSTNMEWFDIQVRFSAGKAVLPVREVLKSWIQGKRYHKLDDGTVARLPSRWLAQHGETLGELEELRSASGKELTAFATLLADEFLGMVPQDHGVKRWRDAADKLKRVQADASDGVVIEPLPPPPGLQAELRDYQLTGYRWLMFLRDMGLGGVLADDMGLGKTVQALAALLATHAGVDADDDDAGRPSLVVAPASVVYHWEAEAKQFAPELTVKVHHGANRATTLAGTEADVFVTSYALLRIDAELFGGLDLQWLILDEAQNIKNPHSKVAQAARAQNARHRLALTGTPVENNLYELWSLFQFLMPGFFGSKEAFGNRYARRIHKYQDAEALDALRARIKPFVLRRLKSEVAAELPSRTELVLYCDLPPAQWELYERVKRTYRDSVMKRVKEEGVGKSTIQVLEALMRLRQAACDPRLLPFDEAREVADTAKLTLLFERLEVMLDAGHKVLVFSQWPSLLRLVAEGLVERDMGFLMLDGSTPTKKRPKMVETFNDDEGPPVFLISLKAGGTGLTLTAADHVIHLDPWWNPAVEAQATDRAHRIGQDKPVVAYKIVARGTVEEQILVLQDRKRELFEATVDADRLLVSQLTAEDLAKVFA